jgi:adenine phosphoribosyltransferase
MHEDGLAGHRRVLIVDDLLATGGTAMAALRLVHRLGSEAVGCAFVIELKSLGGRARLDPAPCSALVEYD